LITGILLRDRALNKDGVPLRLLWGTFCARRSLRILPPYYFALIFGLFLQVPRLLHFLPWHLTYTTNVLVAHHGDFNFAWIVGRAASGFSGVTSRILDARPIVYLGKISYGINVYQGIVPYAPFGALGWRLPEYHTVELLLFLPAVTILVSMLSWHIFEKPLHDLKQLFPYAIVDGQSKGRSIVATIATP
jgi:peptidoglycan/LPS O-acetylase OafA/YrhL